MKFSCDRGVFARGIGIAGEVISSKNAVSIMSNVLLDAKGERLTIKATDAKTYFETNVPIKPNTDGASTLFCDKLSGILGSIPAGDISLESADGKVVIKSSAKKVRFQVKSISSEKFPEFPTEPDAFFSVPACDFLPMIDQTISSISDDETRYFLNGIYFEHTDDGIAMVSTDGRRLAFTKHKFDNVPAFNGIIVPPKFVSIIKKYADISGSISIGITSKMVFAQLGDVKIASVLIEGSFPNYHKVIPDSQDYTAKVNRKELSEALKRVSLFTEKAQRVIFNFESNKLTLESDETDLGKSHEELDCEYAGTAMQFACNYRYFDEPLRVFSGESVTVQFTKPDRAITVKDETDPDTFHIVMPMQIG